MKEKPGKLTSSQAVGKVTLDKECSEQAHAFTLCNVMLPTVPVEDYSCGFWAAEIMLQLCLDKVSLVDGVNVTFNLEEYRKYLYQLVQTRFLGIDGTLRRASQPHVQIIASVSEESVLVVADD